MGVEGGVTIRFLGKLVKTRSYELNFSPFILGPGPFLLGGNPGSPEKHYFWAIKLIPKKNPGIAYFRGGFFPSQRDFPSVPGRRILGDNQIINRGKGGGQPGPTKGRDWKALAVTRVQSHKPPCQAVLEGLVGGANL